MILKFMPILPICLLFSACFGPRDIDYKSVWKEQGGELRTLVRTIKTKGNFQWGNHDFPTNFSYPFDDGFHVKYGYDENGKAIQLDSKNLTIEFYTDRGLMDHFSAFIYTNDPKEIEFLDEQTNRDYKDKDVKLETHWYYVQD